jgi:hypothetical protein
MTESSHFPVLTRAIEIAGLGAIATACGVTYQAIRKWEQQGRLPRTEWTGETEYAVAIQKLTKNQVRRAELLAPVGAKNSEAA